MALKSFSTPNRILTIMEYFDCGGIEAGQIFVKCARIYDAINIFNFKTIFEWTVAISVIFNGG